MSSDERVMDVAAQRLFEEMAFAMKTDIDTVKHAFFKKLDGDDE